jgi:chromosome partitioning protein
MKKVFAFCNQKGGVGKTTSVINIAAALTQKGYKVLIVDLDSQANATSGLGQEKPEIESTSYQLIVENSNVSDIVRKTAFENLFIVPSNMDLSGAELELVSQMRREYKLKDRLSEISDQFDFIFLDCPPSLGLISINALTASDFLIIPLQCEYYALEGLSQLINTFQLVKKNLNSSLEVGGVLMTMADSRTNLTQQVIEEVKGFFKDKVFENIIPRAVKLSEAPSFGKPAVFYDASNRGSKSYLLAADEFEKRFSNKRVNPEPASPAEPQVEEKIS